MKFFYYLFVFLFLLVDIVVLQPVKVIASLIIRCLWWPSFKVTNTYDKNTEYNEIKSIKYANFIKKVKNYDHSALLEDGDGFKFLSYLYTVEKYAGYNNNKLNDDLKSYMDEHGVIGRHPVGNEKRKTAKCFSGDMLSGLLYYMSYDLMINNSKDDIDKRIFNIDINILKTFFFNTIFGMKDWKGRFKMPFRFETPNEEEESDDRGSIYPIYTMAPNMVRLLAFVKCAYLYTKEKKYNFLYWILRIFYFPMLLVNPGDYAIFMGRVSAIMWFTSHSYMLHHTSLYLLTKCTPAKRGAKRIKKMYKNNFHIQTLWNKHFDTDENLNRFIALKITDYANKGSMEYDENNNIKYFSLRSFKFNLWSPEWLNPVYLGHKYMCENNYLKAQTCNDSRRKEFKVDELTVEGLLFNK